MTMPAALSRQKLAKVLALMSSDHPGERAAAAASADRLVKQHGIDWPEVLGISPPVRSALASEKVDPPADWKQALEFCDQHRSKLSGPDLKLVRNLVKWRGRPRQGHVDRVMAIQERLKAEEA